MVGHARGPETDNTKKHLTPPPSPLPQQRNKQSPESFSKEKKRENISGKRVRNYSVCMRIQYRIISVTRLF